MEIIPYKYYANEKSKKKVKNPRISNIKLVVIKNLYFRTLFNELISSQQIIQLSWETELVI